MSSQFTGFCVGFDEAVVSAIAAIFNRCGLSITVHGDPTTFAMRDDLQRAGCVVMRLPENPQQLRALADRLAQRITPLAVVYITERADLQTVVEAVRTGAIDVLGYPCDPTLIRAAIEQACRESADRSVRIAETLAARQILERLNRGEREVLNLMLAGRVNKSVASRLGIALRTVENRRKQIFTKLGTRSLADIVCLVQRAEAAPQVGGGDTLRYGIRDGASDRAAG